MTDKEDEEISKDIGQFQLNLNKLLAPLRLYGQEAYVDTVTPEIIKLAWQLHFRLEGLDIPYEIEDIHW